MSFFTVEDEVSTTGITKSTKRSLDDYNEDDDSENIDVSKLMEQHKDSPKSNESDEPEIVITKSKVPKIEINEQPITIQQELQSDNRTSQTLNRITPQSLIHNSMNTSLQPLNPMFYGQEIQPFNQSRSQEVSMYNNSRNVNNLAMEMNIMNTVNRNNDEIHSKNDKLFNDSNRFSYNGSSMYRMENITTFDKNYDGDIDLPSKLGEMTEIGNSLNLNHLGIEPLELTSNEMNLLERDVPVEVLGCENGIKNLIQILRTNNNLDKMESKLDIDNYLEGRSKLYNRLKNYKHAFKKLDKEHSFDDRDLNTLFHAYLKFMTKHLENPKDGRISSITGIKTKYGYLNLDNIEDLLLLYRYDMVNMHVNDISFESFYKMLYDRTVNYFNFYIRFELEKDNAIDEIKENFRVMKKINYHYLNTINSLTNNLYNLDKLIHYIFDQHAVNRELIKKWIALKGKIDEVINGNNIKNENINDIYEQIKEVKTTIENESSLLRGTIQENRDMINSNRVCLDRVGNLLSIIARTSDFKQAQESLMKLGEMITNPTNNISSKQLQQIYGSTQQLIVSNLQRFDQCVVLQFEAMLKDYAKNSVIKDKMSAIDNKIAKISQLDDILTKLTSIESDIDTLKNNNVSLLQESNNQLKTDVESLQNDKTQLSNKVKKLETKMEEIQGLLNKLQEELTRNGLKRDTEDSHMTIRLRRYYNGKDEFINRIKMSIGKKSIIQDYSNEIKLCGVDIEGKVVSADMIIKNDYDDGIYKKWIDNILTENISLDEYIRLRRSELEEIHKCNKIEINGTDYVQNKSLYIAEYILQVVEELNKYNISLKFEEDIKSLVSNCNDLLNGNESNVNDLIDKFNALLDSLIKEFITTYKGSGYVTVNDKEFNDGLIALKSKFDKIIYEFGVSNRDDKDVINAINSIAELFKNVSNLKVEGIDPIINVFKRYTKQSVKNDKGIIPIKTPFKFLSELIYSFNHLFNSKLVEYQNSINSKVVNDKSDCRCRVDSNGHTVNSN